MLTNCNALSTQRLQNTTVDFKRHVQMLTEMKKDLSQVFERIRKLKIKLANQYPKQFAGKAAEAGWCSERSWEVHILVIEFFTMFHQFHFIRDLAFALISSVLSSVFHVADTCMYVMYRM